MAQMVEQLMLELEQASQVVLAPPNIVTNEQRHAAEEVFLKFKKTKFAFNTCTYLLEHTKNDYVLFQAASTIKDSMVREWPVISGDDVESMRKFLLHFVINRPELQNYVREQILQTVAVIFKRATIDTKDIDRDSLFSDVTQLISSGNLAMQMTACSILTALLNEYSTSSKSSSVGLTWEYHIKCKKFFEDVELEQVFLFCIEVLTELEKQPSPLSREATAVLNRFLAIAEDVLSWQFIPLRLMRRHIGSFIHGGNTSLRPGVRWRPTLLNTDLLQLLLKLHQKISFNSEMSHHCLQCISQLASMNGDIFANDRSQVGHLKNFLEHFLKYMSIYQSHDYEAIDIASIFENLVLFNSVPLFVLLPPDVLAAFFQTLTRLTCEYGRAAALEEAMHKDDTVFMEAYEKLLQTWMSFMRDGERLKEDQLQPSALEIFNTYVHCHLSAPEGSRNKTDVGESGDDEEDYEENDEDDHDLFKEQLTSVGLLARKIPSHSVPLLAKLLEARVGHLSKLLHGIHSSNVSVDMKGLNNMNEDIHWLLLLSGCVLSDEYEGESPLIPHEIMQFSLQQASKVNVQSTAKLLATSGDHINGVPAEMEHEIDSTVRLISAIFNLCEVEKYAVHAGMAQYLSPQVSRSLMWFLSRWLLCYLLPDENHYSELSMTFVTCFGRDTEGANWVVKCLLDKIVSNLSVWTAEPDLVKDTAEMMVSLVNKRIRCSYVIKFPTLWDLAKQQAANQPPLSNLPSAAKRLMLKGLLISGLAIEDENNRLNYLKELIGSTHTSLRHVTGQETFMKTFHEHSVKMQVISLLESFCGITLGSQAVNSNVVFNLLHPALVDLVAILGVYHNYEDVVQLILEIFSEAVQQMICYLDTSNSKKMFEVCLSLIQMYSKHNSGKRIVSQDDEEDKFTDVLLMMDLLMNMLSKDFIDFGTEEGCTEAPTSAADIVLYGLNIIVPLMDADILKFPTLCSQYYKLISFIADLFPEKMCNLPDELFRNLMMSVDLGLSSFGPDICRNCLELLGSMAEHVCEAGLQSPQITNSMAHFLRAVFQMLLIDSFNMDLVETAGRSFFALICCQQNTYRELVQGVLSSQTDEQYLQRLLVAFNDLTPASLNLAITRASRIQFRENLDRFLINVRGFLCVK